jgi:hypothetical protein
MRPSAPPPSPPPGLLLRIRRCLLPTPSSCSLAWLMDHSRGLIPNRMQAPGIHFQHPDQPPGAATLPQTHPLKTRIRIATLLQALHFMRGWQVNPFYRGFRHLSCPFLVSWDLGFCPAPRGRTHARAVSGPFFRGPIINGWVFPKTRERGVSSFNAGGGGAPVQPPLLCWKPIEPTGTKIASAVGMVLE